MGTISGLEVARHCLSLRLESQRARGGCAAPCCLPAYNKQLGRDDAAAILCSRNLGVVHVTYNGTEEEEADEALVLVSTARPALRQAGAAGRAWSPGTRCHTGMRCGPIDAATQIDSFCFFASCRVVHMFAELFP